jgi:hypothetical protein
VGFLVEPQNQGRRFVSGLVSKPLVQFVSGLASKHAAMISCGLASKPAATVSGGLASKPTVTVSRFGSQNRRLRFGDLGLKITAAVSWFVPQNQVGFDLSVAPQNRREGNGVGHASRSSGLLRVEASWARVFQSSLKTGGGAMTSSARGTIVEVASK